MVGAVANEECEGVMDLSMASQGRFVEISGSI